MKYLLTIGLLCLILPHGVGSDYNSISQDQSIIPSKTADLNSPALPSQFEYTLNVVFLGFEGYNLDTNLISSILPTWYAPKDRIGGDLGYNKKLYGNYTFNYLFNQKSTSDVLAYKSYIDSIGVKDTAPYTVQDITDTATYVPSSMVESYLNQNFAFGPTIVLIDTYSSNTTGHTPYFYNSTEFDLDVNSRPRSYGGKYQISGGGKNNRLLWYDFAAGPTEYRGAVNALTNPPIWDYSPTTNATDLLYDMAYYIQTAIELRFVPSYIYEPVHATQAVTFEMLLIDLTGGTSSIDWFSMVDGDALVNEYAAVNPTIDWDWTLRNWDWSSDLGFSTTINQAYNASTGDYDRWPVLNYLDSMYSSLFSSATNEHEVIPMFLFAFPGSSFFSEFLGIAWFDDYGEFSYVVASLNEEYADPAPNLIYPGWVSTPVSLNPGWYQTYYGFTGNNENFMRIDVTTSSGSVDLLVLDEFNYNKYQNNQAFTSLYDIPGINTANVSIDIMGNYYFVFENNGAVTANFDVNMDHYSSVSYGFTFVIMHEGGHALGLSHPHDRYSYIWGYEYLEWLWDLSYTQMTYGQHYNHLSKLDRDSLQRGMGLVYLEELVAATRSLITDLQTLHEYVPTSISVDLENLTSSLGIFIDTFDSYIYDTNLLTVIQNYEVIISMISDIREKMNNSWNVVNLNFIGDLTQVDVDLVFDLSNGTYRVDNITKNNISIHILQWENFTIHVFVDGTEKFTSSMFSWDVIQSYDITSFISIVSNSSNEGTTQPTSSAQPSTDTSLDQPENPLFAPISPYPILIGLLFAVRRKKHKLSR